MTANNPWWGGRQIKKCLGPSKKEANPRRKPMAQHTKKESRDWQTCLDGGDDFLGTFILHPNCGTWPS